MRNSQKTTSKRRLQILGGSKIFQKEIEKLEKFIRSGNKDEKFVEYNENSFASSSQVRRSVSNGLTGPLEQLEISDRERKMHKCALHR